MLTIVAHHYVVNSGLLEMVPAAGKLTANDIFILLFGWGGKTGINCFVLITGFFMCTSKITVRKYVRLLAERYFYYIIFFLIFVISGYMAFSFKMFANVLFPFFTVADGFTSCFLLFYLFIPFLNKLIEAMSKKEHLRLLILLLGIYTILPSLLKAHVWFNYITWFGVIYLTASYIRLYPKKWFSDTRRCGFLLLISLLLSWASIVIIAVLGRKFGLNAEYYFFVSDSNKILAVLTSVCAFLFFKNVSVRQSRFINKVAESTFGVLLIHGNSSIMCQWLWKDTLNNARFYNSPWLAVHAVCSVIGVYVACTIIDRIRIVMIERPVSRRIFKD